MTKRMLIDSTHAEETRVVVLDGNRLEDFDVETSTKRQLKGNIYLAKIVRVEPSLQAAFVEYGGNRHGFLAFGEIHPDYYQIPVADRQRLIAAEAAAAREEAEAQEREDDASAAAIATGLPDPSASTDSAYATDETPDAPDDQPAEPLSEIESAAGDGDEREQPARAAASEAIAEPASEIALPARIDIERIEAAEPASDEARDDEISQSGYPDLVPYTPPPETVGGETDMVEEAQERRPPPRFMRNYKIQEVIHRRQIMLVQVVKEERGTKGAALTTFLSLAGRYCVLMPNSPRGGGISRKITSAADRKRLKEITTELDIPDGMGLIVRTAGAQRPKPEIKRDCEYLLRLWDDIRDHTMKSVAPALIYEEASLIKRAIRDVYSRDVDEVQVDGEAGWRAAHEFMRMLMPTHAKKVQLWRDPQPLFAKMAVEAQLDAMMSPTVQLRSGGYLVINQAEALVAIDVNSGRSTRERGIEETALRTNLEAADEVARQLRLRDLAGLIVIDFIDMESKKHNGMVERRLKDALKNDRARIQLGHISHFGLLEMSRQRLRPSLAETSFVACPHCGGAGHVRSIESAAIHVLRDIEEEGAKRRAAEIIVHVAGSVAMYLLNHKRDRLAEIESRYEMRVMFAGDDSLIPPQIRIERLRAQAVSEARFAVTPDVPQPSPTVVADAARMPAETVPDAASDDDDEAEETTTVEPGVEAGAGAEDDRRPRRRRRRRRGGRRDDGSPSTEPATESDSPIVPGEPGLAAAAAVGEEVPSQTVAEASGVGAEPVGTTDATTSGDEEGRARRRGRRGGRRRRRDDDGTPPDLDAEQPDLPPVYTGPTPANPFGGQNFDIFDLIDAVEPAPQPAPKATSSPPPARPEPEQAAGPELHAEPVLPTNGADRLTTEALPAPAADQATAAPETPEPIAAAAASDHGIQVTEMPESTAATRAMPEAADHEGAPHEVHGHAAGSKSNGSADESKAEEEAEPVTPEPAVKPVLVGVDTAAEGDKKRGWWRR